MGSIGLPEILIVLVVALIVLGPTRLPEAARQFGRAMSEFRRVSTSLQTEVREAFSEPPPAYPDPTVSGPSLTAEAAGTPPAGAPAPPSDLPSAMAPSHTEAAGSPGNGTGNGSSDGDTPGGPAGGMPPVAG